MTSSEISIHNIRMLNKNSLVATFDIKIPKWGNFIIRRASLFTKANQKWISFPSEKYEKDGQSKYYAYNLFEQRETQEAFMKKVMTALETAMPPPVTQLPLFPEEPKEETIPF